MQGQEKELFQSYEIKNWNFSPRLYKIFAAAAVFNLLTIFVAGQANVFTTRGCDSPLVGNFCSVLDTIYLGGTLLTTDSEFVSKDYVKNEIGDAEITYIDVTGVSPPLTYPEGYFALANPNEFAAMQNPTDNFSTMNSPAGIPGFPMTNPTTMNGMDLMNTPQTLPTQNNKVITGDIPTSPFTSDVNPIAVPKTPLRNRNIPRNANPTLPKIKSSSKLPKFPGDDMLAENKTSDKQDNKKDDTRQNDIKSSDPVAEIEINRKPFEELGDSINDKIAKKEIDLTKPFLIILDGTIADDGTLDSKKSKYVKSDGDEKMVLVAKDVIEAVGNSKFLTYLKNSGVDRVNFTLVQDDKQIYIKIISDQKTPEKAGTTASSLNNLLSVAKFADANGLKKLDENSKTLIDNSKVTNEGKNFILNFAIPKQDAQDIINRELKKRADKKAAEQPNSSAEANRNLNANLSK